MSFRSLTSCFCIERYFFHRSIFMITPSVFSILLHKLALFGSCEEGSSDGPPTSQKSFFIYNDNVQADFQQKNLRKHLQFYVQFGTSYCPLPFKFMEILLKIRLCHITIQQRSESKTVSGAKLNIIRKRNITLFK